MHAIEEESLKYNMFLNKGKCEIVAMSCTSTVKFMSGEKVKQAERAKYLGVIIDEGAKREYELEQRLAKARDTGIKLRQFWKKRMYPQFENCKYSMQWYSHN